MSIKAFFFSIKLFLKTITQLKGTYFGKEHLVSRFWLLRGFSESNKGGKIATKIFFQFQMMLNKALESLIKQQEI